MAPSGRHTAMAAKGDTLSRLALASRRGGAVQWHLKTRHPNLSLATRVGACLKLDLGARAVHRTQHLNGGIGVAMQELREADASAHYNSAVLHASGIVGSDVAALASAPAEARTQHYRDMAHLLRFLGEAQLPCVAVLDGCVSGGSLGVGAHAAACVVTERTRASLPGALETPSSPASSVRSSAAANVQRGERQGSHAHARSRRHLRTCSPRVPRAPCHPAVRCAGPAHGFVPESFAAYQLSRLPQPGLAQYVALTGASLRGTELVELGLATHATESQAVERITTQLRHQRVRHLGRTLRNVELACIEPEAEVPPAPARPLRPPTPPAHAARPRRPQLAPRARARPARSTRTRRRRDAGVVMRGAAVRAWRGAGSR